MLQTADLNGGDDVDDDVADGGRQHQARSRKSEANHRVLSTSYEESSSSSKRRHGTSADKLSQSKSEMVITKGDVVRIHVPYTAPAATAGEEVIVTSTVKARTIKTTTSSNKRLSAPPR